MTCCRSVQLSPALRLLLPESHSYILSKKYTVAAEDSTMYTQDSAMVLYQATRFDSARQFDSKLHAHDFSTA